jgi:uncharacterized membrane protein YheB (UPF0754 family)
MMKILIYCSIPIIAGLIGWLTNFIAVKMIFRPRKAFNILGVKVIGLIPKRKADLAEKIAQTVEKELISHKDIRAIIQTEDFHAQMSSVLRAKIEEFIIAKISSNSLLSMFVTTDTIAKLSLVIMDELETQLPGIIDDMFQKVEQKLDFNVIIRDKIMSYDLSKLESIIYNIAEKELKAIEYLGGVLGFVVGLIQLGIVLLGEFNVF